MTDPPPHRPPPDVARPPAQGAIGHLLAVVAGALLIAFRWAAFDVIGLEAPVAWSVLFVAVLGRFFAGASGWTLVAAGLVPVVWLGLRADASNAPYWPAGVVIRIGTYLLIAGYLTRQRERRRLRAAALRQSEQEAVAANDRWRLASEFAQIGTFDWDFVAEHITWSPVMEQLHGFAPGEHDGKPGTGFRRIHPDDVSVIQRAVEEAKATGKKMSLVYRARLPDGRERWIEGIGRVQMEAGRPRRVVGVCIDVTARHEAQLASARFEVLTEHAPVGIYHSDRDGNCRYVNPAWTQMLGTVRDDLRRETWSRFIHPDDRERILAVWEEYNREPRPFSNDLRYVRPDGRIVHAVAHNAPLFDEQGRYQGFVGCVTDLTARREAEASLENSEARFRALVDNAGAAVFMKDAEGRYQIVNTEFERLMQRKADEIIGRSDEELFPPQAAQAFRDTDRRVWETGRPEIAEEFVHLVDGPRCYLSVKYPITDGRGRVTALGGFATDITARKQMEDELRRDRKLLRDLIDVQEQERQYICNELHDGTIQYLVGALMRLQSPAAAAGDRAALEQVEALLMRAAAEARRLIAGVRSSLLDDMGVAAAIDDLVAQNRDQGLDVRVYRDGDFRDLDDKLAVTVFRVVQEALSNVRKHAGVARAEVELRRGENSMTFIVRDEGRGFAPGSEPPECFGLRGMRERVILAGGKFSLDSAPEEGTTVRGELPLTPPRNGEVR